MPLDFPGQIVKSPQILFHLLLVVAIFPLPHPRAIRFLRSNRQISKSPISYLLLVVAIFPLPRPCGIRFPRSNRQISKSPISHLLLEVAIFPVPRPCAIRFIWSNRQIPTSPISFAFTRGRASWLPLPILFFNGKLPEAMWETAEVHSETGYRQQQGDTRPASRVASR